MVKGKLTLCKQHHHGAIVSLKIQSRTLFSTKAMTNCAPWFLIVASPPTGGAVEPVPVQRLSPLHPSALPHQVDQRERLLGL